MPNNLRAAFAALLMLGFPAAPATAARPSVMSARLIAATAEPRPGETVLVGLEMTPRPGWHGYWSNPGDSGLAPVVKWSAPGGVRFGPLRHPAPTLMQVTGLASYIHAGPHVLLARMTLERRLRSGTALPIVADVRWAACSDTLCVPQHARLTLRLKAGRGEPSGDAAILRKAASRLPRQIAPGTFRVAGGRIMLQVPGAARLDPARARFFPDTNGYWNAAAARRVSTHPLKLASRRTGPPPARITGVLPDGERSYRLAFTRR